jgi:hypothetical protein
MRAATPLSARGVALGDGSTGQIGDRGDTLLEPVQKPFAGRGRRLLPLRAARLSVAQSG